MKKTTLELIQERANQANGIPTAVIEYNIKDLPKDENITKTSFYGVKARRLKDIPEDTISLTYTY